MAVSEHDFQIEYNGRGDDRLRTRADTDNEGELRDILHGYLESKNRPRDTWSRYTISTLAGFSRIEVRG